MLTDSVPSVANSSTAISHNHARVLLNAIGRCLYLLLSYLRNVGHPWWELG
jgi:hypothetical protein